MSPQPFSQVRFINASRGASMYPMVKDSEGNNKLWDSRDNDNVYWLLSIDQDKVVDFNKDTTNTGETVGASIKDGTSCTLGFDVVAGDDDWVSGKTQLFVYKEDSRVRVTIRKYGGLRDGDAAYDGAVNF